LIFWVYRFGIDFGFLENTWNWDYIKDIGEEESDHLPMEEC